MEAELITYLTKRRDDTIESADERLYQLSVSVSEAGLCSDEEYHEILQKIATLVDIRSRAHREYEKELAQMLIVLQYGNCSNFYFYTLKSVDNFLNMDKRIKSGHDIKTGPELEAKRDRKACLCGLNCFSS